MSLVFPCVALVDTALVLFIIYGSIMNARSERKWRSASMIDPLFHLRGQRHGRAYGSWSTLPSSRACTHDRARHVHGLEGPLHR